MNLYIVTFYDREDNKDWQSIVSDSFDSAVEQLITQTKEDHDIQLDKHRDSVEAYIIKKVDDYNITVSK